MIHQNKTATSQQKQEEHEATFGREPREILQPIDEQIEDNPKHGAHQYALYQTVKVVLPCEALNFLDQFVWCRHTQYRMSRKDTQKKEFRVRNSIFVS